VRELTPEEQLARLHQAYQQIPDLVLDDLRGFIAPDELTFVAEDPTGRISAYNEGLRAVWIHLRKRLNLVPPTKE
jgi:hypothetical protein